MEKDNAKHIVTELHDGLTGGHFSGETTTHKVLRVNYYWPTLFKDAHAHACKCQIYQVNVRKERKPAFPLQIVTVHNPFEQWGLDVVGKINPNFSKLHRYILTAIDYFFKWIEANHLKVINDNEVIDLLQRVVPTTTPPLV